MPTTARPGPDMARHRRRRRTAQVFVPAALGLALAGCGTELTPEQLAGQCSAVARLAATAGLAGTPSRTAAKASADGLDGVLGTLRDPRLHDAAVALHSHLHGVEEAIADGDDARAAKLAAAARKDVTTIADVCAMPESQFLGGATR